MKTMAIATTALVNRGVVVWLHTAVDPTEEEWALGVQATASLFRAHRMEDIRSVVVSDGGAPNAKQRRELAALFGGRPSKLSLITNSLANPLKRGVATAISWLNSEFKAVEPVMWREALRHLDLEGQITPLLKVLHGLQRTLPPVQSLLELERLSTLPS